MRAMAAMNPSMMQGMMRQDADMAFACSMLAHHQGAIAMARVELEHGKDEEMKKMAQKMIDDQTREVGEMTKWIEAHAASRSFGRSHPIRHASVKTEAPVLTHH